MPVLIGLDIGTSSAKAIAFNEKGFSLAEASAEYPCYREHPGWAEHDPEDWWKASCAVLKELREKIGEEKPAALGVDGMSWCVVPVDREGHALTRSPIWMDTRAEEECRELSETYGSDALLRLSGNPVAPGFSLPKALWLLKHNPGLASRTAVWLESNAFINYRLTGTLSIDPSQGFGWSCYDIQKNAWDCSLCRELGLEGLLPPVFASHQVIGKITRAAAESTGLPEGMPVIAGGMDTSCGCLAAGLTSMGQAQEQGGQSGGVAVFHDRYAPDPRLMIARHVVPGGYLYCGATVGGSSSYAWFEREFGLPERKNGKPDFNALNELAASVPAGSEGLVFLPYMNGERTPIFDANAKGMYFGLDFTKTRAHMTRATLEGVACSVRHCMETIEDTGISVRELFSVGGATRSPLWMQIKSDLCRKKFTVRKGDAGSALGAAMTAGVGIGLYSSFREAADSCGDPEAVYLPGEENQEVYDRLFSVYTRLYPCTSELMHQLKGFQP